MASSKSIIYTLCGNFSVTETSIWYFTPKSYYSIMLNGAGEILGSSLYKLRVQKYVTR